MDVFTNPPSNTYQVNTKFSFSLGGNTVTAIAVTKDAFQLVSAAYTILIQILFSAAWNIVANVLLWKLNDGDKVHMLGLVAFWNCSDPFSAAFSSLGHLLMLLRRGSRIRKRRYLLPAITVTFLSASIAVTSVVIGIYYPKWLEIEKVAPAHPAEVYFPYLGQPTGDAAVDFGSFDRPSILRALGSAEAGELNTQLAKATIESFEPRESNLTQPQQVMQWHYTLTSEGLNMQIMPDLEVRINGSCATEYRWLHSSRLSNKIQMYMPWDDPEVSVPVSSDKGPPVPGFATVLRPGIGTDKHDSNRSFAFLALTSQAMSFSEGNDPWYLTTSKSATPNSPAPYKVKEGRPALSCWETTNVCMEGSCYSIGELGDSPLPKGMQVILASLLNQPAVSRVGMRAGVSSLKSYTGSLSGLIIDAKGSSLVDDMTRLILAGYLWTRKIMRDLVLSKNPNARNSLEQPAGKLLPGAAAFVVRSDQIVTLSFSTALAAPVLTVLLILIAAMLPAFRKYDKSGTLAMRAAALRATQPFRAVDEASNTNGVSARKGLYNINEKSTTVAFYYIN